MAACRRAVLNKPDIATATGCPVTVVDEYLPFLGENYLDLKASRRRTYRCALPK
jgi:hypothetical protein